MRKIVFMTRKEDDHDVSLKIRLSVYCGRLREKLKATFFMKSHGQFAQSVEQMPVKQKVTGSSPVLSAPPPRTGTLGRENRKKKRNESTI